MELSDRAGLKARARELLSATDYSHRSLVLLHTGGNLTVNLTLSILLYAIGSQMEGTGGLAGMQTRAIWSTLQTILFYAVPLILLLWQASYYRVAIGFARGERVQPNALLSGFRHPLSVLGCNAWPGLQYMARAILCTIAASIIISFTPFVEPIAQIVEQLPTELVDGQVIMVVNDEVTAQLVPYMTPILVVFALLFIPSALRLFCRYRLAMYLLMDGNVRSCLTALRMSRWKMFGRKLKLFRLDLSFWWYYLLQGVALAVCYLQFWLPYLGITLPISGYTAGVAVYLLYALVQLGVDLAAKNYVTTTYALAYDAILEATEGGNDHGSQM